MKQAKKYHLYLCVQFKYRCHEISKKFFGQKNGDSGHTTYAMGHAHIDTGTGELSSVSKICWHKNCFTNALNQNLKLQATFRLE